MDIIKQEVVLTINYVNRPIPQAHNAAQKLNKKYGKDNVRIKKFGTIKTNDKLGRMIAYINLEKYMEIHLT